MAMSDNILRFSLTVELFRWLMNLLQGRLRSLLAAEIAIIQFFLSVLGLCFLPIQAFCRLFSTLGMVILRQFLDRPKNPFANLKYFFLLKPAITNKFKIYMQSDQSQFSEQKLISIIQTYDWKDALQNKSGDTPTNPYYRFKPELEYSKYYRLFRVMLSTEEISQRCFHLTSLMLRLKFSNYYAMMLRKSYFTSLTYNPARMLQQLCYINDLLNQNSKEYQLWTYKKHLFKLFKENCSSDNHFYAFQIEFLQGLLEQDSKNYHVWDYRLWLVIFFQKESTELESSYHRIFVQSAINKKMKENLQNEEMKLHTIQWQNCYSLWSYRYNLSHLYFSKTDTDNKKKFELQELERVRKWLSQSQNLGNECGWNYYIGIALNYASVSRQKLQEILGQILLIFDKQSENRFVGNACLQLLQTFQERSILQHQKTKRNLIQKLNKIDPVRKLYYDYLLKL